MAATFRWVMFDADNTLFDFDAAEDAALRATFEQLQIPFQPEYAPLYHQVNAQVWKEFEQKKITSLNLRFERFVRLFALAGIDADGQAFSRAYLPNLARGTQLIDGAEWLVRTLRDTVRLALVTNGLRDVQRPRLERSRIADCFEVVVVSDEIGLAKPEAGFFEYAFDQMGRPHKEEVLLVGDSLSTDILGGVRFGLTTCWYNPAKLNPNPGIQANFEVSDLREVAGLISRQDGAGKKR